jgi:multicomponent Na+:H+ antiporter subunit B
MTPRQRLIVFLAGAAGLAALLAWGVAGLPGFGDHRSAYGQLVTRSSVPLRNATDVVTVVNLDVRGLDTIGEEFILFCSVTAAAVLLRRQARERVGAARDEFPGRRAPGRDDAVLVLGTAMGALVVCFGLYVVGHGQLTPGGGFQGGGILAAGVALLYLASGVRTLERMAPEWLLEVGEAVGAGAFVLIGLASLAAGAAFLQDLLPLGSSGTITAGGTLGLINAAIGLEVAAGISLVVSLFLVQLARIEEADRP